MSQPDFSDTQTPREGMGQLSMLLTDREVYEIECLAARLTLISYRPGIRMSLRRAIEDAVSYATRHLNLADLKEVPRTEGEKKHASFRVRLETKEALREITKTMGWGSTDTTALISVIAMRHRALDESDRLQNQARAAARP